MSFPYTITAVAAGALRVCDPSNHCGLDRYGVTKPAENAFLPKYDADDSSLTLYGEDGAVLTTVTFEPHAEGWKATLTLTEDEELYGLGDVNRERLDKHGFKCRMWIANVNAYAPIPFLMSSRGWAVLFNTTWEHRLDVGATDRTKLAAAVRGGAPDLCLFTGKDYAQLLERYTSFSGRPNMLPRWAMGLTFVCNENADVNAFLSDAMNFRREDIPCDVLGLEPGWMEKNYDGTIHKEWNKQRFPIPPWSPKGPHTFLGAVGRLGFKLSLWLCCDYDLTVAEEKAIGNTNFRKISKYAADPTSNNMLTIGDEVIEEDDHFANSEVRFDRLTDYEQPWFKHLEKFVDQGASCFKLDGAYQVLDHPDRRWANGMTDKEEHNLYPVLYAKQMVRGFEEHTGRRAMVYSAGGYTGVQQYAATWAGDTGGGFGPLVSQMNHGLSGHSNTSCDMNVFDLASIHFGFLMPWSQLNSWAYYRHPWLLAEEDKNNFRAYDKLRYSLVPYLYTAAHQAWRTGLPMMRALTLVWPKDKGCYERLNEYMLGDSLLVGVFLDKSEKTAENGEKVNLYLPQGVWYDYFTGDRYDGGREIFYQPPKGKGGALFVRSGSVVPTMAEKPFIGDQPDDRVILRVWGDDASGEYVTDDGVTLAYRDGKYTVARLTVRGGKLSVETLHDCPDCPLPEFTVETVR